MTKTIHGMKIVNFSPSEFHSYKRGDSNYMDSPYSSAWFVNEDVVWWCQMLRNEVGKMRLTSAYRSLKYNRLIGSKDTSQHPKAKAVDIHTPNIIYREKLIYHVGRINEYIKSNNLPIKTIGGIGIHVKKRFLHLDIRKVKEIKYWTY